MWGEVRKDVKAVEKCKKVWGGVRGVWRDVLGECGGLGECG